MHNPNDLLALRAIVVSGRAALRKTLDQHDREHIRARITDLLAQQEERLLRDGADAEALAYLEKARRDGWE